MRPNVKITLTTCFSRVFPQPNYTIFPLATVAPQMRPLTFVIGTSIVLRCTVLYRIVLSYTTTDKNTRTIT